MAVNELISAFVDPGSFVELDTFRVCGIVAGLAMVQQRPVALLQIQKKKLDVKAMQKTIRLLDAALSAGAPLVMFFEDKEELDETQVLWEVVKRIVRMSGVCPMIAFLCGPMGSLAKMLVPYADFRIYCDASQTKATCLDLPGVDLPSAIERLRTLLSLLPSNCAENAPLLDLGADINDVHGNNFHPAAQDMAKILADNDSIMTLYQDTHFLITLTRIGGRPVGLLATDGSQTQADCDRFIRFCDCYSLPVVWLSDGSLSFTEKLAFALSEATTTKIGMTLQGASLPNAFFDIILSLDGDENAASDDRASVTEIRNLVINALELFSVKRDVLPPHKHGNIPL